MAIDIFDTKTLQELVIVNQEPTTFLLKEFFPDEKVFGSKSIDFDLKKNKKRIAAYVNRRAQGQNMEKTLFEALQYVPPYLKPKKTITVDDLLKRAPGDIEWVDGMSQEQRAGQIIQEEFDDLDDAITRAEELQASQALLEGKITPIDINGNPVGDVIDFQRDSALTVISAPLWDSGTPKILADIRKWKRIVVEAGGIMPTKAVLGSKAVDALLDDDEVLAYLDNRRFDSGSKIVERAKERQATYIGNILEIDFFSYDGTFLDQTDTSQNYMPANKMILGSAAENRRNYGVIEWLTENDFKLIATPRLPVSWVSKDPAARYIQMHSAPLLVTRNPDVILAATVTS